MAQIPIEVNGKPYVIGCEDGQETRLRELAALVDSQIRQVSNDVGQLGETRLLLMGALLMADELTEARVRQAAAESDAQRLRERLDRSQAETASVLESAAERIEAMAARA